MTKSKTNSTSDTTKAKKVATKAPAKKAATKTVKKTAATSAKKAVSKAKASVTIITATTDVGFGNAIFLRGSGAGLSWEKGLPLTYVPDLAAWQIVLENVSAPLAAKFVLNDVVWATGEDIFIQPALGNVFAPSF